MPLDPVLKVAERLHDKGMKPGYDIALFHATGSAKVGGQVIIFSWSLIHSCNVRCRGDRR